MIIINLIEKDYVDDESEEEDDERGDDEDQPMNNVLRQRGFNKYKRFNLNNFRDDDEDFEGIRYNELKNVEEDKSTEENGLDSSLDDFEDSSEEKSLEEDEYEETEESENAIKDQNENESNNGDLGNQDLSANISEDKENEKLLSPFMTNLSPTSSSDIIFNELSMQTSQLDPSQLENEIQLAKLKRIISDGSLITNNSNAALKSPVEVTNPLADGSSSLLSTQYSATLSNNNSPGSNRGGPRGGGNKGGNKNNDNKRNLLDHLILIRKRRQANKSSKGQLESKKGNSNGNSNGKSNRN